MIDKNIVAGVQVCRGQSLQNGLHQPIGELFQGALSPCLFLLLVYFPFALGAQTTHTYACSPLARPSQLTPASTNSRQTTFPSSGARTHLYWLLSFACPTGPTLVVSIRPTLKLPPELSPPMDDSRLVHCQYSTRATDSLHVRSPNMFLSNTYLSAGTETGINSQSRAHTT